MTIKSLEIKLVCLVLAVISPITIITLVLLSSVEYSGLLTITIGLMIFLCGCIGAFSCYRLVRNHLLTLTNLVESIRHDDFSYRVNLTNKSGALKELCCELNALSDHLQDKHINSYEMTITLEKLIEQIDIPVIIFDDRMAVVNANQLAAKLFNLARKDIIGLSAEQLKVDSLLNFNSSEVIEHHFPTQGGRWEVKSKIIISAGARYHLLVMSDISRTLRIEERHAWSRMVRVIGHEINNSLTSISSLSDTLLRQLNNDASSIPKEKLQKGLSIILERGDSLQRFMSAYANLAKLPEPVFKDFELANLFKLIVGLYPNDIILSHSIEILLCGDQDQLQSVLINLIKNALEASKNEEQVTLSSQKLYEGVVIRIVDSGPGIANVDNLFVPFYTTKPEGTGIGLVLSREIVEAHGGTLHLYNRPDSRGCIAEIWLPDKLRE